MKDEFEDFVRKNRSAFDDKEPREKVWTNIESAVMGTQSQRSIWNNVTVWRAAAVVFMALSVYLLSGQLSVSGDKVDSVASANTAVLKEFTDVEKFYFEQISQKTQLIDEFQRTEGLNGFTHDFKQLEAMYMVLKEEMKNRPSQKVKDALVLNLLVRIDLLNQQLHKLENGEYAEPDASNEKKSTAKNV